MTLLCTWQPNRMELEPNSTTTFEAIVSFLRSDRYGEIFDIFWLHQARKTTTKMANYLKWNKTDKTKKRGLF